MKALALVLCLAALASASCGGGADGETNLVVAVDHWNAGTEREEVLRFVVRCDPPGGTVPDPAATCALIANHPAMVRPPSLTGTCAGGSATSPPGVAVRGVAGGKRVAIGMRGCDQPDAIAEAAVLWMKTVGLGAG